MKFLITLALLLTAITPAAADIRRVEFLAASYTEALPTGDVVALRAADLVTARGLVPMGGSGLGPIFTRTCVADRQYIAGVDHGSGRALLWNGAAWERLVAAHGVNAVAFDPACRLWVVVSPDRAAIRDTDGTWSGAAGVFGSQGIRYMTADGAVTGDATYGSAELRLYEFTRLSNGVAIGQGDQGGVVAVTPNAKRYQLEPGETIFVRAHLQAGRYAVATWKPRENKSVALVFDEADLASFPEDGVVVVPPPPPPPPPPPQWPLMPDRTDVIADVAAKFPAEFRDADRADVSPARKCAFIRRAAWALFQIDARFGLNGKRGTDELSCDALAWKNPGVPNFGVETADVICGAGGPSPTPCWQNVTDPNGAGAKWIQPEKPAGSVDPPPPDCKACDAERKKLSEDVNKLRTELTQVKEDLFTAVAALAQTVNERDAALEVADKATARAVAAETALMNVTCEPRLSPGWAGRLGVRASCTVKR